MQGAVRDVGLHSKPGGGPKWIMTKYIYTQLRKVICIHSKIVVEDDFNQIFDAFNGTMSFVCLCTIMT